MKILVTAGASWVKIDDARVFTNRFTGKTGLELARALKNRGNDVTLMINPHCLGVIKNLRIIQYRYFDEFAAKIKKELKCTRYDAIIHNAALNDYRIDHIFKGKIPSGKKRLVLTLLPIRKVIKDIRRLAPSAVLVQFKLEAKRKELEQKAFDSLIKNNSDYVVANAIGDVSSKCYRAVIIDRNRTKIPVDSRRDLAKQLNKILLSGLRT